MLSALLPRAAAEYIVKAKETQKLLKYLKGTWIPDESFWGTLSGNIRDFPIPGGLDSADWINFTSKYKRTNELEEDVTAIRSYYISRYQVWRHNCKGRIVSWSCLYGVEDYASVIQQPHLIAHKMYIDFQPATLFCALKAVRYRTLHPIPFDTTLYSELPQVELKKGIPYEKLSHPEWMSSMQSAG